MSATLELPAELIAGRQIGPWLVEVLGKSDAPEETIGKIELALVELCNNIIAHGYASSAGSIQLESTVIDDVIKVTVIDAAPDFDPENAKKPDEDNPQVHGYGLMLIKQLTTDFTKTREADKNHWCLTFALT